MLSVGEWPYMQQVNSIYLFSKVLKALFKSICKDVIVHVHCKVFKRICKMLISDRSWSNCLLLRGRFFNEQGRTLDIRIRIRLLGPKSGHEVMCTIRNFIIFNELSIGYLCWPVQPSLLSPVFAISSLNSSRRIVDGGWCSATFSSASATVGNLILFRKNKVFVSALQPILIQAHPFCSDRTLPEWAPSRIARPLTQCRTELRCCPLSSDRVGH